MPASQLHDVRPSAIFDIGYVKLKAGWEYGKSIPQDVSQKARDARNGYGLCGAIRARPLYVEFGGSFARGFEYASSDKFSQGPDLVGSNTVQTYGGFLNASPGYEPLVLGFGAFQNHAEDFNVDQHTGQSTKARSITNDQIPALSAPFSTRSGSGSTSSSCFRTRTTTSRRSRPAIADYTNSSTRVAASA